MAPRSKWAAIAAAAVALVAGIAVVALPGRDDARSRPELGLFTSLPIYWAESDSIAETLQGGSAPHWARTALEAGNQLRPLDTLDGGELSGLSRLMMAQPRPLAPAENVALDGWVRGGGRLLLFADPMLTEHSRFALGDRRRPQDVVLLSPILRHWGLELEFDEDQSDAERTIRFAGSSLPVRLAGAWRFAGSGESADCTLAAESVVVRCRIGEGEAVIIADASLLERERDPAVFTKALSTLVENAFGE